MGPLATTEDIEGMWRPLSDSEKTVATNLLAFASAIVRKRVARVDARIADETLDRDLVAGIVCLMVIRVLRNPGGLRSQTAGQVSVTMDTAGEGGALVLTEGEAALLGGSRQQVGTIRLTAALAYPSDV